MIKSQIDNKKVDISQIIWQIKEEYELVCEKLVVDQSDCDENFKIVAKIIVASEKNKSRKKIRRQTTFI